MTCNVCALKTTKAAASALKPFIFWLADLQSYMYGLWSAPFIFGISVGQKLYINFLYNFFYHMIKLRKQNVFDVSIWRQSARCCFSYYLKYLNILVLLSAFLLMVIGLLCTQPFFCLSKALFISSPWLRWRFVSVFVEVALQRTAVISRPTRRSWSSHLSHLSLT